MLKLSMCEMFVLRKRYSPLHTCRLHLMRDAVSTFRVLQCHAHMSRSIFRFVQHQLLSICDSVVHPTIINFKKRENEMNLRNIIYQIFWLISIRCAGLYFALTFSGHYHAFVCGCRCLSSLSVFL